MSKYRSILKFGAVAVATGLMLGVVACGGDDDDEPAATATRTSTTTSAATTTAEGTTASETSSAAGETVEVTAVDYEFEGLPDTVEAGTTFTMTNDSEDEAHEMVALRIPDTEVRSVEELLALPEEELGELAEIEPAFVLVAAPGEEAMTVLGDGTIDEPGRYLFACFIPVGADPDEILSESTGAEGPPAETGPPHFTEGMFAEVTVE